MTKPLTVTHEAMKTVFTFRILSDDPQLAKDTANASVTLLDEIENALSRYVVGGDVWLINHMSAGETRFLSEHCYNCLRLALEAYQQTGGLFDITLGQQIEHQKKGAEGPLPELAGQLMVDPDKPAIHCTTDGRQVDLGGIGKGYALDQIKLLMQDWGIESALLSAGASTQLAFGSFAWNITLAGDTGSQSIELKNQALSASGTAIQGSHIVSPRDSEIDYQHKRIWFIDSTATFADAWSTAIMLMNANELTMLSQNGATIYAEVADKVQLL